MSQKLARKDINLLDVYQVKKEPSKYTSLIKYVSVPLIGAVVFLGIFGFNKYRIGKLNTETTNAEKETQKLTDQMANDPNAAKYTQYVGNLKTIANLSLLHTNIQSYPQLSQDTFDQIVLAAGLNVDVTSFSYVRESQVITLTVESLYANDTENFVRRLKTSGAFAQVDYSGYSKVERSTSSETPNDTAEDDSTEDATKKLLEELLNIKNNGGSSGSTTTQTTTQVYTATVLCVLK